MEVHGTIKKLREEKGYLQKQVAAEIELGVSHYNKIEKGQREASIKVLDRLAKLYGITIDQIVNPTDDPAKEVTIEDKTSAEQIKLIQQLDEKDRSIVMSIIDTMLTKINTKSQPRLKDWLSIIFYMYHHAKHGGN